jgi:protein-S-isoprenylcysteine O-methyltransferase Ste14
MQTPDTGKSIIRVLRAAAVPLLGLGLAAFLDAQIRSGALQVSHLDMAVSIACILLGIGLACRLVAMAKARKPRHPSPRKNDGDLPQWSLDHFESSMISPRHSRDSS